MIPNDQRLGVGPLAALALARRATRLPPHTQPSRVRAHAQTASSQPSPRRPRARKPRRSAALGGVRASPSRRPLRGRRSRLRGRGVCGFSHTCRGYRKGRSRTAVSGTYAGRWVYVRVRRTVRVGILCAEVTGVLRARLESVQRPCDSKGSYALPGRRPKVCAPAGHGGDEPPRVACPGEEDAARAGVDCARWHRPQLGAADASPERRLEGWSREEAPAIVGAQAHRPH